MTTATAPIFPIEILELIFSDIDDQETLNSWALVSRDLTHQVRQRVFCEITLSSMNDSLETKEVIKGIKSYVKYLDLEIRVGPQIEQEVDANNLVLADIIDLIAPYPCCARFRLYYDYDPKTSSRPEFSDIPSKLHTSVLRLFAMPNIESIELKELHLTCFLSAHLSACPQLKSLSIHSHSGVHQNTSRFEVDPYLGSSLDPAVPNARCQLRHLLVRCRECARNVANNVALTAIESLHLHYMVAEECLDLILRTHDRSLRHLSLIDFDFGESLIDFPSNLNLQSLRSLTISHAYTGFSLEDYFRILIRILEVGVLTIPYALESIIFKCDICEIQCLPSDLWHRLWSTLSQPRYEKLEEIKFKMRSTYTPVYDGAKRALEEMHRHHFWECISTHFLSAGKVTFHFAGCLLHPDLDLENLPEEYFDYY